MVLCVVIKNPISICACYYWKGDHVVCSSLGYQSLSEVALAADCNVSFWNPEEDKENGSLCFDVGSLKKIMEQPTPKLLILNAPHNPSG